VCFKQQLNIEQLQMEIRNVKFDKEYFIDQDYGPRYTVYAAVRVGATPATNPRVCGRNFMSFWKVPADI
jgi:hypothetical protein